MGGAFFMHDTVGLPLGEQILAAAKCGFVVSVMLFFKDAVASGWPRERARKEIFEELRMIGRYREAEFVDVLLERVVEAGAEN